MFVQQKNAETGELEWAVVDIEGEGEAEEALSSLLQTSLYLDMLHDKARNRAYRLAIEKAVQPGDHVLDIGTGTGLLALMAARVAGETTSPSESSPGTVTACELFPPMAKAARRIISENGVSNISVITKRSDELIVGALPGKQADMPRKADVVVTEIFDSELLGEGILPTMRHAVQHLLKDGGRIVPAGAHVYGQLVECAVLEGLGEMKNRTALTQPTEEFFRPLHLDPLFPELLRPLSEPFRVFSFDFAWPPLDGGNQRIHVRTVP